MVNSPSPKPWDTLSDGAPICITPRGTMTLICVTRKEKAASIYQSMIYDMVIFGLADIANITVAYHGSPDFPTSPGANTKGFAANYPPSLLQLSIVPVTSLFSLPVFAAADFLAGLQALTHYLTVQEMTFGVFDVTSGDRNPVAIGCLAFDCADYGQNRSRPYQEGPVISNTKLSSTGPGRLSTPTSAILTSQRARDNDLGLSIDYITVPTAASIPVPSYVDAASDTLWQIIGAIIASHGDALMPPWTLDAKHKYGIFNGDWWGHGLLVLIVQDHDAVENLTLGLAAGVLKITLRDVVDGRFLMETELEIGVIDSSGRLWSPGGLGCLRYVGSGACPGFDDATLGNGSSVNAGNETAFPLRPPIGYKSVPLASAARVASVASFASDATS